MKDEERLLYLDSSALVKLILPETESRALFDYLARWPDLVSSDIARVEVQRAARRVSGESVLLERTRQVLESVHLVTINTDVLETASQLTPEKLGSLDAIHLATAIELGEDLAGFVAYDQALIEAARAHGLITKSPA